VLNRCGWHCQTKGPGCERRATQADHIIPVAEGGQTTMENGAGICVTCHKIKTQAETASPSAGEVDHAKSTEEVRP